MNSQNIDVQLRLQSSMVSTMLSTLPSTDVHTVRDAVPLPFRPHVRVLNTSGEVVYSGDLLQGVPTRDLHDGFADISIGDEGYRLITTSIVSGNNERIGFLQIIGNQRMQLSEMPGRILSYLLISSIASIFIFLIVLYFAHRSLKPAQEAMERLEQFTQDASHELRTPLATISSSLELARKNKRYDEAIDSAVGNIDRITQLITHLLTLARLDKQKLKKISCDITALLQSIVTEQKTFAKQAGITIETHLTDEVLVMCDPVIVRQLFSNLLTNAIKFNRNGGKVYVRLDMGSCEISDTGIGMDDNVVRHIFDRFYQADPARSEQGYGLGLSLVKKIADLHQWTVSVHSIKGDGTEFKVVFS
jgi:signal transduction histidine kinase